MTKPFSCGHLVFTLLLFLSSCRCNNHRALGIIMFWKEIAGCGFSLKNGLEHRVSGSSRSANSLKVPKDSKSRRLSSLKTVSTQLLKIFSQNAEFEFAPGVISSLWISKDTLSWWCRDAAAASLWYLQPFTEVGASPGGCVWEQNPTLKHQDSHWPTENITFCKGLSGF